MKTMLDLTRSATKVADASIDMNELDADKAAIAAFEADGGQPDDYRIWRNIWTNMRTSLAQQKGQDSPATVLARAAQARAAAAAARSPAPAAAFATPLPQPTKGT